MSKAPEEVKVTLIVTFRRAGTSGSTSYAYDTNIAEPETVADAFAEALDGFDVEVEITDIDIEQAQARGADIDPDDVEEVEVWTVYDVAVENVA